MKLQAGDVVCTYSKSWLGKTIRAITAWNATDADADFNHALLMIDEQNTFESLATISSQNFFKAYNNANVLIVRPQITMTSELEIPLAIKQTVVESLMRKYKDKIYPYWKLPFFCIPALVRYFNIGSHPVCSELVALYLWKIGVRHDHWKGTSPDNLADEFEHWKNYIIVYKGKLQRGFFNV